MAVRRRVLKAKLATSGQSKGRWWLMLECGHVKFVTLHRKAAEAHCQQCTEPARRA